MSRSLANLTKDPIKATIAEAVIGRCFSKRVFLKILQISHENTCIGVSFNKFAGLKETPTQVISVKFAKILRTRVLYNISGGCLYTYPSHQSLELDFLTNNCPK